ncbi:MAG: hypothetical protein HRT95_05655 [Moritella sp.]|uniref:hypothetical protein n=1 Tax=Moritella sp. TaxID=78556 RepID=UPI001D87A344|nr:hypothetical protein [Moritella sp.]NQZ49676.1 hypothetical protein [Moritella sp.]
MHSLIEGTDNKNIGQLLFDILPTEAGEWDEAQTTENERGLCFQFEWDSERFFVATELSDTPQWMSLYFLDRETDAPIVTVN